MSSETYDLFRTNTIEKVQSALCSKRLAVEKKKDELRSLVGERHRDVIEAADSIQIMKTLSSTILDSVADLKNRCMEWDRSPAVILNRNSTTDLYHALPLAAHLKFLNNVPNMIQNFLDSGDYFSSSLMLFVGRFASTKLKLGSEPCRNGIESCSLISRLEEIFDHIESYILRSCRHKLSVYVESPKVSSQCLVSLVLLENLKPADVVQEYFDGRRLALERIIGRKGTSVEPTSGHLSVRTQVTLLARFLISTLHNFDHLFCGDSDWQNDRAGSVFRSLSDLRSWSLRGTGWLDEDRLFSYLPDDLLNLHPGRRSNLSSTDTLTDSEDNWLAGLSSNSLYKLFISWWSELTSLCCSALTASLAHVSSVASLISIRTGTFELAHNGFDQVAEIRITSVHSVRLWEEIFAHPFLAQLSTLFNRETDGFLDEWISKVEHLMKEQTDFSTDNLAKSVFADLKPDVVYGDNWSGSTSTDHVSRTDASWGYCNTSVFMHILHPENFGLIVFCLLAGRPIPESTIAHGSESLFPTISSPPASLLLFLQRAAQYHHTSSYSNVALRGESVRLHQFGLDQKLLLMPPSLHNICSAFNTQIEDLVTSVIQSAGPDWLPIWTTLFSSMNRLVERLVNWADALSYENCPLDGPKTLKIEPFRGSLLSKSIKALLETCPSICASVMASAGVIELARSCDTAVKSDGVHISWPEPSHMTSAWNSTYQSLINFSDRLLLDCLSEAVLDKSRLEQFSTRMRSSLGATDQSDPLVHSVTELLIEHDPCGALSQLTVPFDSTRIELDAADERAAAVIHVPSSASLPLHEFLLTAVRAIGCLVLHLIPSYPLNQELSFRIFSNLLDIYAKLLETLSHKIHIKPSPLHSAMTELDSSQFDLQPVVLQWIFDLRFLQKLLMWSEPAGTDVHWNTEARLSKNESTRCLLHSFEALIDPFDREVCFPMLVSSVERCLQSTSHLYAPLTDARFSPQTIVNPPVVDSTNPDSTPIAASLVRLLPVSSSSPVFPTLDVSLTYTDQRNPDRTDKLLDNTERPDVLSPRFTSLVRSDTVLSSAT